MPTEKEKMLAGQVYNPGQDENLVTELTACKAKCLRYNQLPAGAEKKELLKEILGQSGENCHIESNFWCDYGWNIKVGDNFYANHNLTVLDAGGVTFGDMSSSALTAASTPPATRWTRPEEIPAWNMPTRLLLATMSGSAGESGWCLASQSVTTP